MKNEFHMDVKGFHNDNSREFNNKVVENFLNDKEIKHVVNVSYTPKQSGIALRVNRTIIETAESMIYLRFNLPLLLWHESMKTTTNVTNGTDLFKFSGQIRTEIKD
jgi:hypothetical protein